MDEPLWEQHAGWWQREFTDGADPEYEEQILPLVEQHLAGVRRVLDVGCGEGQVARRPPRSGSRSSASTRRTAQIVEAAGSAAADRLRRRRSPSSSRSGRRPSMRS